MASITIRNLDDEVKRRLRRRAARNDRSMEEEARILLAGSEDPRMDIYPILQTSLDLHVGSSLAGKRLLLIIGGGIAAYKSLDLIRRLREHRVMVRPIMTKAAQEFITPLSVGALAGDHVFMDLFSREDEQDVGHIRLAREADVIVIAPTTADLMAKMANGFAGDLASSILLAATVPVLAAPAMNPHMWEHPATQRNYTTLLKDGIGFIGPHYGEMAESGEIGVGRMAEPYEIIFAVEKLLNPQEKLLIGKTIIVTSGPTYESIDPVRYLANRSSGKQGHAIAAALERLGATVRLVSGPVKISDPKGVSVIHVESAHEMMQAVEQLLPADVAIMVAAVADWRMENKIGQKIKKQSDGTPPVLRMIENLDILANIGHHGKRPRLVIGFAAETQDLLTNARKKLEKKGADWIVANNVSHKTNVMGGDRNMVWIISQSNIEEWPEMTKAEVAERLAQKIAKALEDQK